MSAIRASIVGGSGYVGGELLRLLASHPRVEIGQVTSESHAGQRVSRCHPNLRRMELDFCSIADLKPCDLLFLCLPHGQAVDRFDSIKELAPRLVDLSADFRLKDHAAYQRWYGRPHPRPELLGSFVYGIPELRRSEMRSARWISSAGCNATAVILGLYPLFKHDLIDRARTVAEVKVGSSEGGKASSPASHHPERSRCTRSYKPSGHRHIAEMVQELVGEEPAQIHFSATAIDTVRGILATSHVFLKQCLDEKDVWKIYRQEYGKEPFIRIVKDRDGLYQFPDPKWLAGSNFCDIGFERDRGSDRLVVLSAIDNLMKGSAGQAVQAFNIMNGFPEITGLEFPGLHPA